MAITSDQLAALRKFDEEEFDRIAYSYRSWPAADPEGVAARFNELAAYARKIPDGYALVPIEPTEEMVEAVRWEAGAATAKAVWREMIEAAGQQQGDDAKG